LAVAVSVGTIEVVIPCLEELSLVFTHDGCDAIQFGRGESVVVLRSNRRQPELRKLAVSLYVNMGRLVSVTGEEEEPIRASAHISQSTETPWRHSADGTTSHS
jgi:hypothetical protein